MARSGLRRRLTAVAALALVGVAAVGVTLVRADDAPTLPSVDAESLLASTLRALSDPAVTVSGSVTTTLDLGLPDLPAAVGGGPLGAAATILGDQRWKVWRSPDGIRVAHLLPAREQDLVVNRSVAWWWDSVDATATRLPFPSRDTVTHAVSGRLGGSVPADPAALAHAIIEGLQPCASLSVQGTTSVAGRPAYTLALTPLTADSRVGGVEVAIDAQTRLPLRVEVLPRGGGDPAIGAGYTSVSFDPIDPAMFRFTPPPGATVHDAADLAGSGTSDEAMDGATTGSGGDVPSDLPAVTDVRTFGDCLGIEVAVRLDGALPAQAAALVPYAGPLASVVAVDRGDHTWVLAGLVDQGVLEDRAADLP
jgi:outer membrane lipoprotein-sorting protein